MAVMGKVKTLCRRMDTNQPLEVLLLQLNRMLRGWCAYFRPGVSSATFAYLSAYTWARVIGWLRRKHRRITWKELRRRYCGGRMVAGHDGTDSCSTRRRCAPRATDTGEQSSRLRGRSRDERPHEP